LKRIYVSLASLLLLLILLPQSSALSQTRRRSAAQQQRRASSNAGRQNAGGDARAAGASRVAEQIKLLSRFLYLYGQITNGFDVAGEAAGRGEASSTVTEQIEQSRVAVRGKLRNMREGLDDLELRFRTTPELERYYTSLAGTAALATSAEEQAAANQFDKAGRKLIEAVNKLTDVLLEMR